LKQTYPGKEIKVDSKKSSSSIDVRLIFNVDDVNNEFDGWIFTVSDDAKKVKDFFNKYYSNNVVVAACSQAGEYGFTAKLAVNVGSTLKTDKLAFYSYDKEKNSVAKLADQVYTVDKNGYVHFKTTVGNYIIISDGELVKGTCDQKTDSSKPSAETSSVNSKSKYADTKEYKELYEFFKPIFSDCVKKGPNYEPNWYNGWDNVKYTISFSEANFKNYQTIYQDATTDAFEDALAEAKKRALLKMCRPHGEFNHLLVNPGIVELHSVKN